ncbi:MAG: flagellar protein FliS [Anaerolineales bacterium]|nr:flagellar protein FliS [Anaerolineales bacterium]
MINNPYQTTQYQEQAVMGASPLRLIIMTYDVAIRACEEKNFNKAVHAVSMLRDALNFDYGEAAAGLYRLYQWCLDCIRSDEYQQAGETLKEIREAWVVVEQRQNEIPASSMQLVEAWSTVCAA